VASGCYIKIDSAKAVNFSHTGTCLRLQSVLMAANQLKAVNKLMAIGK